MLSALIVRDYEYQGKRLRCGGTKDKPWFVAQDVCDVLGIADTSSALRSLPDDEKGPQDLRTPGGTQKLLVLYEPGLYRLIFRSNKPEAEAFRRWVFHEVLPSIKRTGMYATKRRQLYLRAGKDTNWIEAREQGIEKRHEFTHTLQGRVDAKYGYGVCTNAIYRPLLGGTAPEVKRTRGLPSRANLRDELKTVEILQVALAETLAAEKIEGEDLQGNNACGSACRVAGDAIAGAVKKVRGQ